jgi:hypothetical protein
MSSYEAFVNPKTNRIVNSLELLERGKENRNKVAKIEENLNNQPKEEGFWSSFTNFFNPFKCDNK